MNLYVLMKLLHVLTAFWLISGVVGRGLAFWQARRADNVQAIRALLQVSEFFERYAVIPVSVVVLLFGLIVTWMQKWPLFGFLQGAGSNWLLVSSVLYVGISAVIAPLGLVARRKEREAAAATGNPGASRRRWEPPRKSRRPSPRSCRWCAH